MPEPIENAPSTLPEEREAPNPLRKRMPLIFGLGAMLVILFIANMANIFGGGGKKPAAQSSMSTRPTSSSPQQVQNFSKLQDQQAQRDAEDRAKNQQSLAAQYQALAAQQAVPGPESPDAAPMTPAQRQAIYGNSPNAPAKTSGVSQAQAEGKQRELAREKLHQEALASDTVAIDFAHANGSAAGVSSAPAPAQPETNVLAERDQEVTQATGEEVAGGPSSPQQAGRPGSVAASNARPALQNVADQRTGKTDPMGRYPFDSYQGRLYRVFEGTILEGVVTNHIDGGFPGPIILMLTTDYYSHDHQELLLPQGTRLIGAVQSVTSGQQRKLFVTFQRIVCPDGFSLDIGKYVGLDVIGTIGLATKVNNHYLSTFAAAAAIGGLGGLAQIGNNGSVFDASTELRNGISTQTAQEGEQILQHFLNRLPTITVKEGSRAKVYIGADILIPSYAEHSVDPAL